MGHAETSTTSFLGFALAFVLGFATVAVAVAVATTRGVSGSATGVSTVLALRLRPTLTGGVDILLLNMDTKLAQIYSRIPVSLSH